MNTLLVKRAVALAIPFVAVAAAVGAGHGETALLAEDTTTSSVWVPKCVYVTVDVTDPPPYVHVCPIP